MAHDDLTQIRVDEHPVGIMGLKGIMEEMAEEWSERPDEEVQDELLKRLSRKNYIPERVRESYLWAFLTEFKKFLGRPYEEEDSGGLVIKVLGQGCAQCDRLEKEVMEVMGELDLAADLEHVRDVKEIGKYGVMGMPALIINGLVKSVGKVPPRAKIKQWLRELV